MERLDYSLENEDFLPQRHRVHRDFKGFSVISVCSVVE